MLSELNSFLSEYQDCISQTNSLIELDEIRLSLFGKQGKITQFMKDLSKLPGNEKPKAGKYINTIKTELLKQIDERKNNLEKIFILDTLDMTSDPTSPSNIRAGTKHPLSQVQDKIICIFSSLGFSVEYGPEIESETYNFEKLNIPPHHPSRDMHDTFYLSKQGDLLRTHTSPVQIRTMLEKKPPITILAPGKVYRKDADISHSPVFHQVEGLYVDKNVQFSDLKGILTFFLKQLFGENKTVQFRPSYFPFTEPSVEIDVECIQCQGKGCSLCKHTGWLEILGAGMVHKNVFDAVGYSSKEVTGFAFGMGVERIAMLLYQIPDIRIFFENDYQFLSQF